MNSQPRKPVSPQLDEYAIAAVLNTPVSMESNEYMRNASALSVLAAVDRKLDRAFIYKILIDAMNVNEYLRRAETLSRVMVDMEKGELTMERCREVYGELMLSADSRRAQLQRQMAIIAEMPYEDDVIN